ncbi:biopolymer transporter ExbD [bacterium]|nr:biopolymer transporter ExbD [bacterium]
MRFKKRETKRLSLDVTPLIDVIFLLLIFFMVSTTFVTSPGIHVNLPKASTKAEIKKPKSIEVTITDKNRIFLNGQLVKEQELRESLAAIYKETGLNNLVIMADGKVFHELVVFVMDSANQVGIQKLSIATTPKQSEE